MKEQNEGWKVLCAVLLLPLVMAVRGWALVLLWRWFVIPLGVVAITFWWGYGLALVVGLFKSAQNTREGESSDIGKLVLKVLADMLGCAMVVLIGWCVQHFAVIGR